MTLLDIAKEVFVAEGWSFKVATDQAILQVPFEGQNGPFTCYGEAQEEQQRFIFYSLYPLPIEPAKRAVVAEFLMRVNMQLAVGSFDFDFDSGEIRCRTSIDVENAALTAALVKNLAFANVAAMDDYSLGIKAVVNGSAVKPAVARCRS